MFYRAISTSTNKRSLHCNSQQFLIITVICHLLKIIEHGRKYDIRHVGYYATRSLRVERFYAYWGQDIDASTTPLECGRGFRVKLDSDMDFIGKEALTRQKQEGVRRMYVQLTLDDHDPEIDPWPWCGEPIYRNGEFAGMVTTAGFGFTMNRQVLLPFSFQTIPFGFDSFFFFYLC